MTYWKKDIKYCRSCYDHLAGYVGVRVTDQLVDLHFLTRKGDKDFELTDIGSKFLVDNGVDVSELKTRKRSFSRGCIDGSEKKPHLAGAVGAAVLDVMFRRGWLERIGGSRGIRVTPEGEKGMREEWKLKL